MSVSVLSQFYRSFPGPSDVQESEMRLLARKYRHPTKQGMCNYLDFHQDIVETQNELNSSKMAQKDIEFKEDEFITTKVSIRFWNKGDP